MQRPAHAFGTTASPLFTAVPDESPLAFARVTHPAMTETLRDMHYELEVGFVRTGRMQRHLPGWHAALGPGDVWLCGAWEPHAYRVLEAPCVVGVFVVSPAYLARLSAERTPAYNWLAPFIAAPAARPRCTAAARRAVSSIAAVLDECEEYEETERRVWQQVLFQQLLLTIRRRWRPPPMSARRRIADPFARIAPALRMAFERQTHVPVAEAARACALSRNTFERVFTQAMGIGFARFALRRRLRAAALALLETDLPVKAIAYEWGFTDPSHLQHAFTSHYGCTPGAYRHTAQTRNLPT